MDYEIGLDVSRYQNEPILDKTGKVIGYKPLDYAKAKAEGAKFAIVRASVGDYYIDPCFKMNVEGFLRVEMETMAYFVTAPRAPDLRRRISADQHYEKYAEALESLGPGARYQIKRTVIDNELHRGATKAEISDLLMALFAKFNSPINYTRATWWDVYVERWTGWSRYDLHVANYTNGDPLLPLDYKTWYIHQFSADGNMQGAKYGCASKSVDLNKRKIVAAEPEVVIHATDVSQIKVFVGDKKYKLVEEV